MRIGQARNITSEPPVELRFPRPTPDKFRLQSSRELVVFAVERRDRLQMPLLEKSF